MEERQQANKKKKNILQLKFEVRHIYGLPSND